MRVGELVHLLIEDVNLDEGWIHVCNQPELGWRIKTGRERKIPLIEELVAVLRRVIGNRTDGSVFLRQRFIRPASNLDNTCRRNLAAELEDPAMVAVLFPRHTGAALIRVT